MLIYFKTVDESCHENSSLSAYKFLKSYSIRSNPSNNTFANIQISSAQTVDLATGNIANITISSDSDLKPTKTSVNPNTSTCSCSKILKQADFYMIVVNQTIQNVSVELVFYTSTPETPCNQSLKIQQTFSLHFLTGSAVIYFFQNCFDIF